MSAGVTDLQSLLDGFLPRYLEQRTVHPRQRQVCAHIRSCRTAALGGYVQACERCDYETPERYRGCGDRHCPKCQGRACAAWCERQRNGLLPVTYHHLVFTVPDALNPWVQLYPRALYAQLFDSAWSTRSAFARDAKRLGGQLGASAVLHTWGQTLTQHVHLHCLVPGGVLTEDGAWQPAKGSYLFPVRALSRHFRGHFVAGLRRRAGAGELARTVPAAVEVMLDTVMARDWVVYSKPCPGHAEQVLGYLSRYTHRTAVSDRRLVGVDGERVALRYTDHRDAHRERVLWLDATELIRRFLLHVLPKGLMRIRHFGFLANRCRTARVHHIRELLAHEPAAEHRAEQAADPNASSGDLVPARPRRRCPRCRVGSLQLRKLPPSPRFPGG